MQTTEFYDWLDFDCNTKTLWIKTIGDHNDDEYPYIVEIRTKDDAYCTLYDKMFQSASEARKHFVMVKNEIEEGMFIIEPHTCWWHNKPVNIVQSQRFQNSGVRNDI